MAAVTRRGFLARVGGAAAALALAPRLRGADGALPNIVFILADDLGQGDPGCYNADSRIPTPRIDRLAAEGMRFTDAHSPSAVCTPTRYGVLTGRYAWRSRLAKGVLDGYSPLLIEEGRMTVASMLKARGYHTACFGKWHLGLQRGVAKTDYGKPLAPGPNSVGFDRSCIIPASLDMPPYVWIEDEKPVEPPSATVGGSARRWEGGEGFWRGGAIAPGFRHIDVLPAIGRKAVAYIEERAREGAGRPFFLYLPLSAPHTPWLPAAEFEGKSKAAWYGDFVAQCDAVVGEVMDALARCGLSDSTLAFVTSDNGSHWLPGMIAKYGHRANNAWRGQKADIHEGGHRVPFIARWPGKIAPGSVSGQLACLVDFMATAAAVAGAPLPPDAAEDSFSLLPLLLGGGAPAREAVVLHSADGLFAIREGPWKLILGLGSGGFTPPRTVAPGKDGVTGQLYNLAADPAEKENLFAAHPDIVARLKALLDKYKAEGRSRPA